MTQNGTPHTDSDPDLKVVPEPAPRAVPELDTPTASRWCVIVWAPAAAPYSAQMETANGAPGLLFAAAAKICDRLAFHGMANQDRRSGGVPIGNWGPDDYVLVIWFDRDGECEIDDSYCQQMRPAQLMIAAKLGDIRVGYLQQRDWMQADMAAEKQKQPSILVPGGAMRA